MRMDGRRLWWGVMVFLNLIAWGCAQPIKTVESGAPATSNFSVLIASQNTKFKEAVVSEIYDELKRKAFYLKIVDVRHLRSQSTREFSAVVIISKSMAGRPDPRVESFIDNHPQKDKFIVLTTGLASSWKPDTPGVDAISSASVMEQRDKIARSIVDKILARVNSRKTQ